MKGVRGESPKTGLGFPNFALIAEAYGIRYEAYWNTSYDYIGATLKGKDPVLCQIVTPKWEKLQCRLDSLVLDKSL